MKPRARSVIVMTAVLALFSAAWLWLGTKRPGIFVEHGPMENFQAICITLGLLFLVWQMFQVESAPRIIAAGVALLYATFLIVEFDTRELGWRAAAAVLNGPVRNTWLAILWVALAIWALRYRVFLVATLRQWVWSAAGLFLVAAGLFWVAGGIVDKLKLLGSGPRNLLGEELLETNAALLMLLAAIAAARWTDKPQTAPPTPQAYPTEAPNPQDSRQ